MIKKDKIVCLKLLEKGPFFDEYLISLSRESAKSPNFSLRAMNKSLITQNKADEDMIMLELSIRTNIRHPFLVNQIFAFQDYDNLYYITEYAPLQLLRSNILPKTLPFEVIRFYTAEIFSCIKYLHKKKQNYTFLCPKNVLLGADGHIKLNYSFCNCIEYSMEDLMNNIEFASYDYLKNKRFGYLSVYWSLGMVMYEMLMGHTPFTESNFNHTVAEILECKVSLPDFIDPRLKDFISLLLNPELETNFPTCESLEEHLNNHPIFEDIDFTKLFDKKYESPFLIKVPIYDLKNSPGLNILYTTDFTEENTKDGYGKVFTDYNTINFLWKTNRIRLNRRI